ncbi:MAG: hypothetical protein JO072_16680 [Parafilimonas sp.]|nr:hypothetical protein [Parafilimonas sp.]
MKQAFLKFSGKKLIAAAFLSASVLFTPHGSNAGTKGIIEIISGENTSIQFSGSTTDALLFKVHINNEKGDNFTLTIKNNNGDVLFTKSFNDLNFQKQFKVLKGDQDGGRYYFTITSNNKAIEDTYEISAASHLVEDVAINKL